MDDAYEISTEQCPNRVEFIQKLFEHYWHRFPKEYLDELLEQQRYNKQKCKLNEKVLVDCLVILKKQITYHQISGDNDVFLN